MDNLPPKKGPSGRIERLQRKLYSKKFNQDEEKQFSFKKKEYEVPRKWNSNTEEIKDEDSVDDVVNSVQNILPNQDLEERQTKKKSIFWLTFLVAAIFFIGSIIYAGYVFIGGGQIISGDDVALNIVGPVSIGGGEKLAIDVIIQNNGPVAIESTDIIVDYPEGTKAVDLVTDLKRSRDSVGTVEPGKILRETIEMAFFGKDADNKKVDIEVEYRVAGSNALFSQKKSFEIVLSAAPVTVTVDAIEKASSGQDIELTLTVNSNSEDDIKNLMIEADYPFGFSFEESTLRPTYGNNMWVFDSLAPDQTETFTITGQIQAQNSEERSFRFNTGIVDEENNEALGVVLTSSYHSVEIERPFIGVDVLVDGQDANIATVNSGDSVTVDIIMANNTNDTVRDIEIVVALDGDVLDKNSVSSSKGFYSSSLNTVTFNKETNPELAQIDPRSQESMKIKLKTKDLSTGNLGLNNPTIEISTEVTGQRISEDNVEDRVNEVATSVIKVLSDVLAQAFTLHNSGAFADSGPVPPQADQETTYTVMWSVSNSSGDLQNSKITANVPLYMTWNGAVSPSSDDVSYDSNSRELTWNIGDLEAGIGYSGQPRQVSFQMTLLSSASQVGTAPLLLNNTRFEGVHAFTGTLIERSMTDVNTFLQDAGGAINRHEIVVE